MGDPKLAVDPDRSGPPHRCAPINARRDLFLELRGFQVSPPRRSGRRCQLGGGVGACLRVLLRDCSALCTSLAAYRSSAYSIPRRNLGGLWGRTAPSRGAGFQFQSDKRGGSEMVCSQTRWGHRPVGQRRIRSSNRGRAPRPYPTDCSDNRAPETGNSATACSQ